MFDEIPALIGMSGVTDWNSDWLNGVSTWLHGMNSLPSADTLLCLVECESALSCSSEGGRCEGTFIYAAPFYQTSQSASQREKQTQRQSGKQNKGESAQVLQAGGCFKGVRGSGATDRV